jgi:hypothetical protein
MEAFGTGDNRRQSVHYVTEGFVAIGSLIAAI